LNNEKINLNIIDYEDFPMDLASSGKFYVGDALIMMENLVKEGVLLKDNQGLLYHHNGPYRL